MASYVIRMSRRNQYGQGTIRGSVFECRKGHDGVSMHLFDGEIESDGGEAYWNHDWKIKDKPGLCLISDEDFHELGLSKPVEEKDEDDPVFGHLHYIYRPCPDIGTQARIAEKAVDRAIAGKGLLKEFLENGKTKTRPFY